MGFPAGLIVGGTHREESSLPSRLLIEQPKRWSYTLCEYLQSDSNHVCIWCLPVIVQGSATQEKAKQTKLAIAKAV